MEKSKEDLPRDPNNCCWLESYHAFNYIVSPFDIPTFPSSIYNSSLCTLLVKLVPRISRDEEETITCGMSNLYGPTTVLCIVNMRHEQSVWTSNRPLHCQPLSALNHHPHIRPPVLTWPSSGWAVSSTPLHLRFLVRMLLDGQHRGAADLRMSSASTSPRAETMRCRRGMLLNDKNRGGSGPAG